LRRSRLALLLILLIGAPSGYLGLFYYSAVSAEFTLQSVSLESNFLDVLLSGQVELTLNIKVAGKGPMDITCKSFNFDIYVEGVYVGNAILTEGFVIRSGGVDTFPVTLTIDLPSTFEGITQIVSSIEEHNGEVHIEIDGWVDVVVAVFTLTIPIHYDDYILTSTPIPDVTQAYWEEDSASEGESVNFYVEIQNVYHEESLDGTLKVVVREDIELFPDEDAATYTFDVTLSPGESETYSDSFTVYKDANTRGFFLKVYWEDELIYEMPSDYPPRLSVT